MDTKVGQRIKLARKQVGYSQSDIAKELKVTPSAVYYWENNKRRVTTSLLKRIAQITGKPLSFFYGDKDVAEIDDTINTITERVNKLTELLSAKKGEYKHLFEMAPDAIIIFNKKHFLDVNKMACELFGYQKKEFLNLNFFKIIPKDRVPIVKKLFKKVMIGKRLSFPPRIYITKAGTSFYGTLNTSEISPGKYQAIIRDVTKQMSDDEALKKSEKKYRDLFESAPNSVIIFNKSGQILQANKQALELARQTSEKMLKKNIFDFVPKYRLDKARQNLRDGMTGKRDLVFKNRDLELKSGEIIYANLNIAPLGEDNYQLIIEDITKFHKATKALEVSEQKYRTYINNSPDGVFVVDSMGKYIEVNPAACKITGYSEKELLSMNISQLAHPDQLKSVLNSFGTLLKTGRVSYELLLKKKDNSRLWTQLDAVKFSQNRFVGFTKDISGRMRIDEALNKKTHDLGERVKELSCLYGISKLLNKPNITLDQILSKIVKFIPPAWNYPEITCARILVNNNEYKTNNFKKTPWMQSAAIKCSCDTPGTIEVGYLKKKPKLDEGPFLKEERALIEAVTQQIESICYKFKMEKE